MTLKIDRLRAAVDWVEEQEKLPVEKRVWDQGVWFESNRKIIDNSERDLLDIDHDIAILDDPEVNVWESRRKFKWVVVSPSDDHSSLLEELNYDKQVVQNAIKRAQDRIAAHCGTRMCVAGFLADTYTPAPDDVKSDESDKIAFDVLGVDQDDKDAYKILWRLFDGSNNGFDIRVQAEALANHYGMSLEDG